MSRSVGRTTLDTKKGVEIRYLSYYEARDIIAPYLIKALEDEEPRVRQEAAKALMYYKGAHAIDPLIKALRDKDPWVRLTAAFELGIMVERKAFEPLLNILDDDSEWRNKFVQQKCVQAIERIGSPVAVTYGSDGLARATVMRKAGSLIRVIPTIESSGSDANSTAPVAKPNLPEMKEAIPPVKEKDYTPVMAEPFDEDSKKRLYLFLCESFTMNI